MLNLATVIALIKSYLAPVKTDITKVEEQITYKEKMPVKASDVEISSTNGYIRASDGVIVGTNAGRCTGYIEIPEGCFSISGKAFLYHEYGVAFFNDGEAYISGVSGYDGASSTKPQKFEINVPENAKYIRWSLNTDDSIIPDDFAFAYIVLSSTEAIKISKTGTVIPLGTDGYINATTGALASSNAAAATDYVEIPSEIGGKVKGKACLYNEYGIAFYTKTKVFISGVSGTSTGQSSLQPQDFEVDIPETAKYMRWCLVKEKEDIQMANKHMKRSSTLLIIQFSSVQSLSCVQLFATP